MTPSTTPTSFALTSFRQPHIDLQPGECKWHSGRSYGPLVRRTCWTIRWAPGISPAGRKLFVCHFIHLYFITHHSNIITIIHLFYRYFNFSKDLATIPFFTQPDPGHPRTFNPENQVHCHALRWTILNFGSPGTFARLHFHSDGLVEAWLIHPFQIFLYGTYFAFLLRFCLKYSVDLSS